MRATSLDRFIEGQGSDEDSKEPDEIVIDTREKNYSGRGEFYDGLVARRLAFLTTTAKGVLAHELGHLHHRDIWFCHYVMATGGVLTLTPQVTLRF